MQQRTALVNHIRVQLAEYGISVPQGINKLRAAAVKLLEIDNGTLIALSKELLGVQYRQLKAFDE